MARSIDVKYTVGFADDTKQAITVGPFDASTFNTDVGSTIKDKIIAYNASIDSDTAATVLSKYGNPMTGIVKAEIISTEVTVYF